MVSAEPTRRFRYLAMLLAKELVVRQVAGGPQEDGLLESLVEVLTAIEERLGRPGRKPSAPAGKPQETPGDPGPPKAT
jgi:hypothetical protein